MTLQSETQALGFTVGICASDSARALPDLLSFLSTESFGSHFQLQKVVVVASGCPEPVLAEVRDILQTDGRMSLIVEDRRQGKAEAINRILEDSAGEFVVMLNSDAFPTQGSIQNLLEVASDPYVGVASAEPIFECGNGLLGRSLVLMWSAHSLLSLRLNHAGVSNHACDELMVVRRSLLGSLPTNVVNDGAYIGGLARARGYLVKFSTTAKVRITIPRVQTDLLRQRRRILFGHLQVWKKLGRPPKTIESLLFMDPLVSLRTVVKIMAEKPRLLAATPLMVVSEGISGLLAFLDELTSTDKHTVWKRNVE
jgi:cellulose synthase/poly-beta-1,6-N-acetylglucosamine synthase-like glycosyltransferase